ncbi:HAD-IIIC family phosphatase [Streptomyces sp. NPDC002851]
MTTYGVEPASPAAAAAKGVRRLRELRAEGRLPAAYPEVASLLSEVVDAGNAGNGGNAGRVGRVGDVEGSGNAGGSGNAPTGDLLACGRILSGLDPDDVLAHHPDTPTVTVAVTGHGTLAQLTDPLTAELARHGLLARLVHGDHGAYLRDLTEPGPGHSQLLAAHADLTLCLLDAGAVFDELPVPWGVDDVADACARLGERLDAVTRAHAAYGHGTLVLNTLPLLRTHSQQLIDERERAQLSVVWREFNAGVLRRAAAPVPVPDTDITDSADIAVIDLDPLVADTPGPAVDVRLARYTGSPFSTALFAAYAREVAHVLRARRRGHTRKCLVLDLDNTLWSGVLGDDGPDGVTASGLRGGPHGALQRAVKQLAAQGVLLAVSSKNDPGPVRAVLREHPEMTLRERDFVHIAASWEPKDAALREIAGRLGIGVDSLVFVDDSPAERALIRHRLPEVAVVPLGSEPAHYVEQLLQDGWFTVPRLTDDDRLRTDRYRDAAARDALRRRSGSSAGGYDAYLHDLGAWVQLAPAAPHDLARIAQLSLRTNQFNLTGERFAEAELASFARRPGCRVLAVRAGDRFGDSGLVGALLVRDGAEGRHLDAVLLSCRVLARGVEQGCLAALLADAARRGLPAVHARYRRTDKNARAAGFYPSLGFRPVPGSEVGSFTHDLTELPPVPTHLTLDADLAEARPGEDDDGSSVDKD